MWGHLISKSRGFTVQKPASTASTASTVEGESAGHTHQLRLETTGPNAKAQLELKSPSGRVLSQLKFSLMQFSLFSAAVALKLSLLSD